MTHMQTTADGATPLDRVWNTRPQFYAVFMDDYRRSIARVDPVLVELCRLRMARLFGSSVDLSLRLKSARAAGLAEDKIAALSNYDKSPLFSERERVCLGFAEQFALASYAIGDDDVARVQAVLPPEDFIYFVKALSVIDQFQRAAVAFGATPAAVPPAGLVEFDVVVMH
jgi:alkylhydroperoxidase family enzyme